MNDRDAVNHFRQTIKAADQDNSEQKSLLNIRELRAYLERGSEIMF